MRECAYPNCEKCTRPDCDMDENDIKELLKMREDPDYGCDDFEYRGYRSARETRKEIYQFLVSFATSNGYMPNYRQIANGIGLRMQHGIPAHLKELEKQGLLEWKTGKPREYALSGYKLVKIGRKKHD